MDEGLELQLLAGAGTGGQPQGHAHVLCHRHPLGHSHAQPCKRPVTMGQGDTHVDTGDMGGMETGGRWRQHRDMGVIWGDMGNMGGHGDTVETWGHHGEQGKVA